MPKYAHGLYVLFAALSLFCAARPAAADDSHYIDSGGMKRHYVVHVGANLQPGHRAPLVMVLHGGGGGAKYIMASSHMSSEADSNNFIVVYPEGSAPRGKPTLTWNAGGCCAWSMRNNVDDVGFLTAVLDEVEAQYPIDTHRVYITGMSNGGMMSYRLLGALSNRIAAVAIVSGAMFPDQPAPAMPVPLLIFHGDKDTTIPYKGGDSDKMMVSFSMSEKYVSVPDAFDYWRQVDGCKGPVDRSTPAEAVTLYRATQCTEGNDVQLYEMALGGHQWPGGYRGGYMGAGGDTPVQSISATQLMLEFFSQHTR